LLATLVEKGLPLGREVSVTSGDAKEKAVVLLEGGRVGDGLDVGGLGGGVHLGEDLLGEGLFNPGMGISRGTQRAESYSGGGFNVVCVEGTYWKSFAVPPASSMPFFSASAYCTLLAA
jgi:hypothetical protein